MKKLINRIVRWFKEKKFAIYWYFYGERDMREYDERQKKEDEELQRSVDEFLEAERQFREKLWEGCPERDRDDEPECRDCGLSLSTCTCDERPTFSIVGPVGYERSEDDPLHPDYEPNLFDLGPCEKCGKYPEFCRCQEEEQSGE